MYIHVLLYLIISSTVVTYIVLRSVRVLLLLHEESSDVHWCVWVRWTRYQWQFSSLQTYSNRAYKRGCGFHVISKHCTFIYIYYIVAKFHKSYAFILHVIELSRLSRIFKTIIVIIVIIFGMKNHNASIQLRFLKTSAKPGKHFQIASACLQTRYITKATRNQLC